MDSESGDRSALVEEMNVAVSILRMEVAAVVSWFVSWLCRRCYARAGLGTSQMKPAKQERVTGIKVQVHS